jgi:hypothetical protein
MIREMKIDLQPGEIEIDTWSLFYLPPGGGKYNGKLTVTNRRLLYEAKFDASFLGTLTSTMTIRVGSAGFLEINKDDIRSVESKKSLFSKKCILTLSDGSQHTFDYGALNIDKTVAAIQAR